LGLCAPPLKGDGASNRTELFPDAQLLEVHIFMKALSASLLTVLVAAMPLTASSANADKTLQNVKGNVTYGTQASPTTALAIRASTTLSDNDFAATGANSQATVTLPDSSQVIMASNSSVQMKAFAQTDIAHATFAVVGKVRFKVNHPQGAQADYHFQTTTGEIAVRGTEGDISANPAGLQVNVYALSNPSLPVQVTLANGQVFTLAAGQSLVATAAAGALTASVTSVTQSLFTPFSELGAPLNAGSLGIAGAAGAAGAGVITTAAAAAVGAAAAGAAISNSGKPAAPAASPGVSVPVTVNSTHRTPGKPPAPQLR
jgi:hypothetical protein